VISGVECVESSEDSSSVGCEVISQPELSQSEVRILAACEVMRVSVVVV
jgi:hypothetical protein